MSRIIDFDEERLSKSLGRRAAKVRHCLAEHPLLSIDAIAELADVLPPASVERHAADQPLVVPGGAPDIAGRPSQTVREIETNRKWMVLWYLEQIPEYARLLDECLDGVVPFVPADEGDMRQRESFLFISAPDAVTPVHFDAEHNFLLQIRGVKEMHVCEFASRHIEQQELIRYYNGGHRNLLSMPPESETFVLNPGEGVYVYPFAPHWVKNGPLSSISLSITFRTRTSQQAELVHAFNARLRRRLRLSPRPAGASSRADRMKAATERALRR